MYLLPVAHETWVLPCSQEEVHRKLWMVTMPVNLQAAVPDVPEEAMLFNGWVKKSRFRVSKKLFRANSFLPLIDGEIEKTSKGCILFVRYRLFFSTLLFLVFWSSVALLIGLYFYVYEKLYLYSGVAFLMGTANYLITVLNFEQQVKISRNTLKDVVC